MRNDLPEDWMLNASCAEIEYQIGKYFRRFVDQCVEIETNDHHPTIVIIKANAFIHKALDVMYLLNTSIVRRQATSVIFSLTSAPASSMTRLWDVLVQIRVWGVWS
jgi:hypothetical protein